MTFLTIVLGLGAKLFHTWEKILQQIEKIGSVVESKWLAFLCFPFRSFCRKRCLDSCVVFFVPRSSLRLGGFSKETNFLSYLSSRLKDISPSVSSNKFGLMSFEMRKILAVL